MKRSSERLSMDWFLCRSAKPADAAEIVLLAEKAIAAQKGEPIPSSAALLESIERNKELLAKETTWSRLVFDSGRLIGLAVGHPAVDDQTNGVIPGKEHLNLLMVDPYYWGQGIGGGLLDWLDSEMASRGVELVDLWTEETNDRSRALYERKGYETSGLERLHPLSGEHQVQYVKSMP